MALVEKNPPTKARDIKDAGSITRSGRPPGGGHSNPLQCSCLENPTDRRAWWATVCRVAESDMTEATSQGTHGTGKVKCFSCHILLYQHDWSLVTPALFIWPRWWFGKFFHCKLTPHSSPAHSIPWKKVSKSSPGQGQGRWGTGKRALTATFCKGEYLCKILKLLWRKFFSSHLFILSFIYTNMGSYIFILYFEL